MHKHWVWWSVCLIALILAACEPLPESGNPEPLRLPRFATHTPAPPTATPTPTRVFVYQQPWQEPTRDPALTPTPDPESDAWAQSVGLIGASADEEPWEEVVAAARIEDSVLVYSDTARSSTAMQGLLDTDTGVIAEALSMSSLDTYLQLLTDIIQGEVAASVYLTSDPPRTLQLLAQKRIWNYVPADIAPVLPQAMREPLLVHHWGAVMLMYSRDIYGGAPVHSWWDLTTPEWRGRLLLPDPLYDDRTLYLLVTLTQHADQLAESYMQTFGQELVLDPDCPDAGYQLIKALLANDAQFLPGDAEIAAAIGNPEAPSAYIGLMGSEQWAKVARGDLALSSLPEVAPMAGIRWPTYLAVVDRAPSPNAAKVVIHWLMEEDGFSLWSELGFFPSREDLADPQGALTREGLTPLLWDLDIEYIAENLQQVRAHIATCLGRPLGGQ